MKFFLRPAGGRLGPLADSGSVLPVGECHEVYRDRVGRAKLDFLRRKRQMANLVRAAVLQEMGDKQRQSANWEECKGSIATLQEDLQGICAAQVKMGHEIASLVTGLQDATGRIGSRQQLAGGVPWGCSGGAQRSYGDHLHPIRLRFHGKPLF